jgi:hypothetical protein
VSAGARCSCIVDAASDSETDNVVACVAKMTNQRLREFGLRAVVHGDPVQLSDEGAKHLVAHCPLMELLSSGSFSATDTRSLDAHASISGRQRNA